MNRYLRIFLFSLFCSPLVALPHSEAAADADAKEIVLGDCLVIGPVGRYGRSPLHRDAVEAAIVAGRWKAPKAGEKINAPTGVSTWKGVKAKDGALAHPALRGGYVYWKVTSDAAKAMLLEASGHGMVYVNGEPRIGDSYSNGSVRLPIQLRAGDNDLLFHCIRGQLHARLTPPPARTFLEMRDLTLPDYVRGEADSPWAGIIVSNTLSQTAERLTLCATRAGAETVRIPLPNIPPLSILKVSFHLPPAPEQKDQSIAVELRLETKASGIASEPKVTVLDQKQITVRLRNPEQSCKRTFRSDIDGSVQYYAVQPAKQTSGAAPALVLTLHGAGVEAIGQADAYQSKPAMHIVAPTNRRPFGFDWEDWGRLDALEVLDLAKKKLRTDPDRTYLTGHSMGGHGVWHLGVTYPDRFAAIAPSAGWISFATYAGGRQSDNPTPMQRMLRRAASPSETRLLVRNCAQHGVFVLHGDADDNVPVTQARAMRQLLGGFHPDFVYHEQPGAGHWWGNACVDWPPLFDFLRQRTLPKSDSVRRVDFITASPGVSAWCHWAGIEAQIAAFQPSAVHLRCDPAKRRIHGTTENVARLALDLKALKPGDALSVELDEQKIESIPWPAEARLWLQRSNGKWSAIDKPSLSVKGPHRYGSFKDAFRNRVVFVYGTTGTVAENAWAVAKARFDAETFWYRGNASVDVIPDTAFDAGKERDRNVILYGHADSNAAWKALLADSPVQVRRGVVEIGKRRDSGDDLACLFVRPRPGSDRASVGVVGGTGLPGLRLTDRLPYFISGVGYPDYLALSTDVLTRGEEAAIEAGFFGTDWRLKSAEFVRQPRYETRDNHDPHGIGKFYMDREIALVMGHRGAGWLERPERIREEQPAKLMEALNLQPGQVVADIGAGSGYHTFRMADKVGAKGKILAVDIQKEMLDIIRRRMQQEKRDNIEPILGTEKDPKLPAGSVDLILLVDVYHEFAFPFEMTQALVRALKPGGRLVFVEFRKEDENVPILQVHKMTKKQVLREMEPHPLRHLRTIEALPWQHVIIFEKSEPRP